MRPEVFRLNFLKPRSVHETTASYVGFASMYHLCEYNNLKNQCKIGWSQTFYVYNCLRFFLEHN